MWQSCRTEFSFLWFKDVSCNPLKDAWASVELQLKRGTLEMGNGCKEMVIHCLDYMLLCIYGYKGFANNCLGKRTNWLMFFYQQNLSLHAVWWFESLPTNYLKLFDDYDPAKVEMYMTLCQAKDLKFGVILDFSSKSLVASRKHLKDLFDVTLVTTPQQAICKGRAVGWLVQACVRWVDLRKLNWWNLIVIC